MGEAGQTSLQRVGEPFLITCIMESTTELGSTLSKLPEGFILPTKASRGGFFSSVEGGNLEVGL